MSDPNRAVELHSERLRGEPLAKREYSLAVHRKEVVVDIDVLDSKLFSQVLEVFVGVVG